jgi:hydroxymethylglutaryl-CoA lyase
VGEFFGLARERLGEAAAEGGSLDVDAGALSGSGASADAVQLTAHFHNTRGQALANVLAALEAGVDSFESSFGELGGCPVPAGATGNVATEDLVSMLHEMGIETGVDLPALLACARRAQEILGRPLGSHTLVAGPVEWASVR